MSTQCSRDLFGYEVVEGRQVVAAFDGGDNSSDAGGLPLGATDRAISVVGRFAARFADAGAQAQVLAALGQKNPDLHYRAVKYAPARTADSPALTAPREAPTCAR